MGGSVTGLSPGQAECVPAGPRGLGAARLNVFAFGAERATVGDLDGDTYPDLVIPAPTNMGFFLLWGAPGITTSFSDYDCCDTDGVHSAAIGDFNKDGRPDLAFTEPSTGVVKIKLARSDAPRAFAAAESYAVGLSPTGIATADADLDGFLDLLVANRDGNTVSFLRGQANGTFVLAQTLPLAGTAPQAVLIANLDGNSPLDLIVLVAEGVSVTLAGISGNPTLVPTGPHPSAVVAGDITDDSIPDLMVANPAGNSVAIYRGSSTGTFHGHGAVTGLQGPAGLTLAELTGDTHLDLAVSHPLESAITLLQGASNGAFAPKSKVPVQGDPRGVVAIDLNADGMNDLAVASPSTDGVYILPGETPVPPYSGDTFSFTAPADSGFVWVQHGVHGHRRYWDYYAPVQPGAVSYALPLPSTLAPSSRPAAPSSGKVQLSWSPWVRKWEPGSTRPFNPREFSLGNLGMDSDTQLGARHYVWP